MSAPDRTAPPDFAPPLVGRERELGVLRQHLDAALAGGVPTCDELQPGGTWLVVRRQGDGTWRGVATVVTLPPR